MDYGYLWEKLAAARRALMLPHTRGEDASVAEAFQECVHGFHGLDADELPDSPREWMESIERLMECANPLSTDQKLELASAIDEFAHWADRAFWSKGGA